jgi:hypothetical protein
MCCAVYAAVPWPKPRLWPCVLAFQKRSHLVDGFPRIRDLHAVQKGIKATCAGWYGQGFLEQ